MSQKVNPNKPKPTVIAVFQPQQSAYSLKTVKKE